MAVVFVIFLPTHVALKRNCSVYVSFLHMRTSVLAIFLHFKTGGSFGVKGKHSCEMKLQTRYARREAACKIKAVT